MKNMEFCPVTQAAVDGFGLSDAPPLISAAADTGSEDYRRNCLAWYLLCSRCRQDLEAWLKKQSVAMRVDMRVRLNQLREQVREMREQA